MSILQQIYESINEKTREYEHQITPYSFLGFFGFILFYFYNSYVIYPHAYENILLRIIAGTLCFLLVIKNFWPQKIKKALPLFWYITILFNLPFFFTFMVLKNPTNPVWPLHGAFALTVLILLVDWLSFSILTSLGVCLGVVGYLLSTSNPQLPDNFSAIAIVYISIIGCSILFSQKNQTAQKAKIQTMKMLAGSIAHELRTPLSAMMMNAQALSRYFPIYQEAYRKAKEANLSVLNIQADELESLAMIPNNLQTLSRNAHTMINMLLTNLNEETAGRKVETCSMNLCVEEALNDYPFSLHERKFIHWANVADFSFLGHKELTKHVMFNLIKNALYAIASAGKGEIFITIETGETSKDKNRLIFKDTGPGIAPEHINHIFDRFYTKTRHGTGIGLAFCQSVIQGFGGEITCISQKGEHTTFTISLPTLETN